MSSSLEKKIPFNINPVLKSQKKITGKKDDSFAKEWKIIFNGCTNIFNGKKLSNNEFVRMFETIRSISNSAELGSGSDDSVSRNYEQGILARGMIVLREDNKEKPSHQFLHKLGEIWTNFYQNILPTLQALFCSMPTRSLTVRQITLVGFRDNVVLKLKVEEALNNNDHPVPKSITQMFCILLQESRAHENHANYEQLERLASRVIRPLLGTKGLYELPSQKQEKKSPEHKTTKQSTPTGSGVNTPDMEVKSNHQEQAQHQPDNDNDDFEELMNFRRQKFNRGGPQHLPCVEEDKGISDSLASLMADGFEFE